MAPTDERSAERLGMNEASPSSGIEPTSMAGLARSTGTTLTRRVRVVIVRDRPSSGGGIVNYYGAIAPHLDADIVFSDVGRPHECYAAVASHLLRVTPVRLLWDWLGLAWKIIRHQPDIVHINPSLDPTTCRSLARDAVNLAIAKLFRRRTLVFWRGWEAAYVGRPEFPTGNHSMMGRLYRSAGAQVVLARQFKTELERWGFEQPIHVETTVAADDIISAGRAARSSLARRHLLYLSRVEVEKGVLTLIRAFALLKERHPDLSLTIAGDGPDLPAAKSLVQELTLTNVAFPGFVSGRVKVEEYRQASVFCFPSSYDEGMPNAVLEAMAMGLPLVCSDAGGLADLLTDGVNGFVLHKDSTRTDGHRFDPALIASYLERLLDDGELYERMATANRECANRLFSAPTVAGRLTNIYTELLVPAGGTNVVRA